MRRANHLNNQTAMKKKKFFLISGVSGEGVPELLQEIVRQLEKIP